jgi:hypothetical protein
MPNQEQVSADKWDIRTLSSDGQKVIRRVYKPLKKEILPEGYSVPGRMNPVAMPDEILEEDEETKKENFKKEWGSFFD